MAWITIKPENLGGGCKQNTPAAKLYATGQLVMNHATVALLSDPDRVTVQVEPETRRIRLSPTTPDSLAGFSLAGGGNSQHRISLRTVVARWPEMAGEYSTHKIAGGLEFRRKDEEGHYTPGHLQNLGFQSPITF